MGWTAAGRAMKLPGMSLPGMGSCGCTDRDPVGLRSMHPGNQLAMDIIDLQP